MRGGSSDGKDKGGDHRTAPNAIAAAAPALVVWDGVGGDYITEALLGASPYFSRSSEVLLSVVVCWRLSLYLSIEIL